MRKVELLPTRVRLATALNLKVLLHICYTDYDYLRHTTFRFQSTDFQLNTDFPSQFRFLTVKSPSVTFISFSRKCF